MSHIAYDLKQGTFRNTLRALSDCDVSIACASNDWQTTAKAAARYIYTTSSGNSYLCTGTLVTDHDDTTQIPYFLTAAHCVSDTVSAGSMDFYWFYRESSCGSNDASWTHTGGGAELLATAPELDSTLVRLNNPPPAGVLLSGWILDSLQTDQAIYGIHHGWGNPKQFGEGNFRRTVSIDIQQDGYTVTQNAQGDFSQVQWNWGNTAPGSSGSGLWTIVQGEHLLNGTLVGGSSSCSAPDAPDEYSRLERFYPAIQQWLGALPALESVLEEGQPLQALTDVTVIGRYLSGLRGSALLDEVTTANIDINALETRLEQLRPQLDIDGDGLQQAERDALLLARYRLGLRGESLIGQMDLSGSANSDAAAITAKIESLLGIQ
ncbi:MAG: trypsin-like serine protease [Thiolinea sp.]